MRRGGPAATSCLLSRYCCVDVIAGNINAPVNGHKEPTQDSAAVQPQQQGEWEDGYMSAVPEDGEPCAGLGSLFSGQEPDQDMVDERIQLAGLAGPLSVRSVAGCHRHTLAHTGLMLWESAPALARAILAQPSLLAGVRSSHAVSTAYRLVVETLRSVASTMLTCGSLDGLQSAQQEAPCGKNGLVKFSGGWVACREEGAGSRLRGQPPGGLCGAAALPVGGGH